MSPRLALALLLVAAALLPLAAAQDSHFKDPDTYPYYPCSKCHATMQVTGLKHKVAIHGIDLTKGAHRALYCANCHSTPDVWNMKIPGGKAPIAIPGLHGRDRLMEMNKVCERCHPQTYMDYIHLVHANKTFTCQGEQLILVYGYKGVGYRFHICPEYRNLTAMPGRACVECHNPHIGYYYSISILPPESDRPAPPPQQSIAYGTLAVTIAGLSLILGAAVLASHGSKS